jgi:hypothetical protein
VLSNDDENDHYVEQIFEEVRSSPLVMDTEQVWLYRAHPHNGKRDAMYDGAHDAVEDLVVFMDSDTIISREDSVHRLIQPFHQGNVGCATGEVTVTNHQDNLLTRITNLALRKSAGCDGGRGSHSGLADVEHEPGRFGNRAAAADELPDRCPDRESRRAMDSHAEVRAMHRRNSLRWSAHFDLCSSLAPKDE